MKVPEMYWVRSPLMCGGNFAVQHSNLGDGGLSAGPSEAAAARLLTRLGSWPREAFKGGIRCGIGLWGLLWVDYFKNVGNCG